MIVRKSPRANLMTLALSLANKNDRSFKFEEDLLHKYGYDLKEQINNHNQLITQMDEIYNRILKDENCDNSDIFKFLSQWISNHIIKEDKKYSSYLNSKNIF